MTQYLQVGGDEGQDGGGANTSVDTGLSSCGAALAPGDETDQLLAGVDDGAAGVTLAGVLATGGKTSADHVGGDGRGAVVGTAGGAGNDGHINLLESGGQSGATGRESSPSSNSGGGAGSRVGAGGGQSGVADGGARGEGGGELPDGNITVVGVGVVCGVDFDRGDLDKGSTGSAALCGMLVFYWFECRIMVTYVGSSADGDGRSSLADTAVSSGDDSVGVQEGTAAEVATALLERDDVGELGSSSGGSTNDVLVGTLLEVGLSGVLGSWEGRNETGGREGNEDFLDLHLEGWSWSDWVETEE